MVLAWYFSNTVIVGHDHISKPVENGFRIACEKHVQLFHNVVEELFAVISNELHSYGVFVSALRTHCFPFGLFRIIITSDADFTAVLFDLQI